MTKPSSRRHVLLVIDMLIDFFEQEQRLAAIRAELGTRINALARAFRAQGQPIIWVRQEFRPDLQDAFLEMRQRNRRVTIAGTPGCLLLPELEREASDLEIVKKRYSAFFGTSLDELLARLEPSALVLAGINTHACVRTTAIDAYQRDYPVILATDCIGSYDREHHEVTLRYLANKMSFLSNDQLASLLAPPAEERTGAVDRSDRACGAETEIC